MTSDQVEDAAQAIEQARAAGGSLTSKQGEHRLQAAMGTAPPPLLGLPYLACEYPAYRAPRRPGYIDFLGCDVQGNLHVVETKIGHDPKVVLQALDYWIWVQPNEDAVRATRNALDQLKEWVASGLRLPVSVNVDAMSLLDSDFPDRVAALLTGSGVPADLLTLEITETAFISDGDRALTVLNRLRQMGVRLALDDFGTGYSAMAYLQQMPLHELKIDRRFITNLLDSRQDRAITRGVIDIAHALDMQVVGEGVEDAATFDALRALKCDEAQGYYLCRPVAVTDLMLWLTACPDSPPARKATADA